MATVRVNNEYWSNGTDSYRACTYLMSYSTSSTDTATTVSIDSLTIENLPGDMRQGYWCQLKIGGVQIDRVFFDSPKVFSGKVKTYSRTTSDQLVNVELVVEGPRITTSGSNTATIPHLESYSIAYNANGGSGAPSTQTKYYGNNIALSSSKPTRANYVFVNWNTAADGTGTTYNPGDTYTGNAALTLYAQWHEPYYITYDANGGSGAPATQIHVYNTTSTLSTIRPNRDGYVFEIWNTEPHGWGDISLNPGGSYGWNSDLYLYAIWRSVPVIGSLTCYRCDANGDAADEGEYGYVGVLWSCDNSNEIDAGEVSGTIAPQTGGSASAIEFSGVTSGGGGLAYAVIPNIDTDMQYTISVRVENVVTRTIAATRNDIITRAFFIMDFKAGGDGLGIGCAAPASGLEVNYPTVFDQIVRFRDVFFSELGGTIAEKLHLKTAQIDRDGANPSSAVYASDSIIYFVDKDGERIGMIRPAEAADGRMGLQLCAIRENDSDAEVSNAMYLWVAKDGTRTYYVDSPENFRSAISAAAASHSHSYLPLSGGTVTGRTVIKADFEVGSLIDFHGGGNWSRDYTTRLYDPRDDGELFLQAANGTPMFTTYRGGSPEIYAKMYADGEGGNFGWTAPDGSYNELDSWNNANSRIYNYYGGGYHALVWQRGKDYNLDYMHGWECIHYHAGGGWVGWSKSDYNEFLVVCRYGGDYNGSILIQRDHIDGTSRQYYLTGGYNGSGYNGRACCFDITDSGINLRRIAIDANVNQNLGGVECWIYARR